MSSEINISRLLKFGNIEVLKEGYVFTLLMTGKGFEKTVFEILGIVTEYTRDKFPLIEVTKNDDKFILIVLKPKPQP